MLKLRCFFCELYVYNNANFNHWNSYRMLYPFTSICLFNNWSVLCRLLSLSYLHANAKITISLLWTKHLYTFIIMQISIIGIRTECYILLFPFVCPIIDSYYLFYYLYLSLMQMLRLGGLFCKLKYTFLIMQISIIEICIECYNILLFPFVCPIIDPYYLFYILILSWRKC